MTEQELLARVLKTRQDLEAMRDVLYYEHYAMDLHQIRRYIMLAEHAADVLLDKLQKEKSPLKAD